MKYYSAMAADSSNFSSRLTLFLLLSCLLSIVYADVSTASTPCVDGTYDIDGRTCCLCGAGLYLETHCTTSLTHGTCKTCGPDKFSSHPNNLDSCEQCRSCSHINANLEEDEPCTPARDTKCRCKKGHFCSSGAEECRICYPCKECGDLGIKVECTATNNTVCNAKIEGGNNTGIIVGIIVPIVLLGLGLVALYWIRRRNRRRKHTKSQRTNGDAGDVELQDLIVPDVDLQPLLPDIADVIGWKDMRDVAMRSSILDTTIESCKLNHPDDSQEQTLELLKIWVQAQGKAASRNLVKSLQNSGKRGTAEKVRDIIVSTRGAKHPEPV